MRRGFPARALAGVVAAAGLLAAEARGDIFILRGGDRVTGKPVTEGKRSFKVKTPYGVLTIPRSKVDRIVREDGREDLINPEPVVTVATLPEARRARLILIITGSTFWQAWDPKRGPDPTLRLEVSLDEEVVATYVDAKTDPDIRGAIVNSFSFEPEDLVVVAGEEALVLPPETRPGRIALKIDLPVREAPALLRLAYQVGEGPPEDRAWRDVVSGSTTVELRASAPAFVKIDQDRGRMEYSGFFRRRMKNVETFRLHVSPERADVEAPLTP